ncbi:hypothetical protein [Effusibacillus lacus]|uniref:Flagellar hook-length control protein FliK n=1 Tax=Effusibacillus lacus TaxID=1348429 RepID=A0A292YSG4_9BACL|nr:hypothetical protein [Effusibacillus lacus]TCS76057.1 hypothetical protein EDD64_10429 [Effusibacillus lacus]GAX91425.1 hypothetical protein EFBL_3094 [Effusibacillus lacus]
MNIWPSLLKALGQTVRSDTVLKGLDLRAGELVQATLLEMLDEHAATLQIKGHVVQARLETQLPKGTVVPLLVVGPMENGLLELKISPFAAEISGGESNPSNPKGTALERTQSLPFDRLLKNLDLPDTPLTRQVVSRLLTAGQSVTSSLVQSIETLYKQVEQEANGDAEAVNQPRPQTGSSIISQQKTAPDKGTPPANDSRMVQVLETIVRMAVKNLPLTPSAYKAVDALWNGPSLGELLSGMETGDGVMNLSVNGRENANKSGLLLTGNITASDTDTPTEPPAHPLTQPLAGNPAGKAPAALDNTQLSRPESPSGAKADSPLSSKLENPVPVRSGEPVAVKGEAAVKGNQETPNPKTPVEAVTLKLNELAALPTKDRGAVLQEAVNRLGLQHEAQIGQLQKAGPEAVSSDTLKSFLLAQLQAHPESQLAERAFQHLAGQQLMHSVRDDTGVFYYHYFSLPVQSGQQTADAKIHLLTRKKSGKLLDPYNCFLYFHLTMPSLGEFGLHVQIVERLVSLRFVLAADDQFEVGDRDLSVLREGLQQAGYQLGTVRKETGKTDAVSPFAHLPMLVSAGTLDLKV